MTHQVDSGSEWEEERTKSSVARTRNWFLLGALGLLILGSLLIYRFGFPGNSSTNNLVTSREDVDRETAPEQDAIAPDFKLLNIFGEDVQLSNLFGKPVLINFWATWCAPCRLEMPAMQDRFEEYSTQGLEILAVNFDERIEDIQAFADEFDLTFDLLLDPGGEIQRVYRIRGYPTSFFLNAEGVIKVVHIGVMTEGQLDDYLAEIGVGT